MQFFRFVNETQYKTEAETLIDAIVYQNGSLALQGAGDYREYTSVDSVITATFYSLYDTLISISPDTIKSLILNSQNNIRMQARAFKTKSQEGCCP